MRSPKQQGDQAPAPGPIAAAVAASAEGLPPKERDLESALLDASMFGRIAYLAICRLGFDGIEPPALDQEDSELVYWTVSQLGFMVNEAKAAFNEEHARKRGAT